MNLMTTIACKLTIQFLLDPLLTFLHLMTDLLTHMQRTELDQSIEEQDSVPELPEIPQLQHLAKNRPKRPKKHASTKNVLKLAEGGDSEDIKEELHGSRHGSLSSASSPSIASRS